MTAAFLNEWKHSSRLTPLYDTYGNDPDMPVDDAVAAMCREKKIPANSHMYVFLFFSFPRHCCPFCCRTAIP